MVLVYKAEHEERELKDGDGVHAVLEQFSSNREKKKKKKTVVVSMPAAPHREHGQRHTDR